LMDRNLTGNNEDVQDTAKTAVSSSFLSWDESCSDHVHSGFDELDLYINNDFGSESPCLFDELSSSGREYSLKNRKDP